MIPSFNHSGVLPPFIGQPHENNRRSPYPSSLNDVASRFADTEPRKEIFRGLLRYRAQLSAVGIVHGCQWLDGSFVEDVESTRGRPPADVDVVTFARRPVGMEHRDMWHALVQERHDLFLPQEAKRIYHCDAYYVDLHTGKPEWLVGVTSYWSGLFSHQRDSSLWKGIVQIDLGDDLPPESEFGNAVFHD